MTDTDVLVVGAGPTGLTLAALLADQGCDVLVVESRDELVAEPRAIALADDSLRTAHALGILDALRPDLVWTSGTRYVGADGRLLARTRPAVARYGFPVKTLFDQPGYVTAVLAALGERGVPVRFGTTVTGLTQDADGVRVATAEGLVTARYVVGCDGGRSAVRQAVGITMAGSSQTHPWIVLDTVDDPRDSADTEFRCDPARPHVVVPGTQGRCRYEFMLLPGEEPEQVLAPEFLAQLLAPFRSVGPGQVRRAAVYVAHQLVAARWREGRVLLAGDAAHLMPPFAGQGLNTGLRDARNLAWKLAAAVRGEAGDALLDTYEAERGPHARAMVRFSTRLGALIMTSSPARARLRDAVLHALRAVPPARRYITELRFIPRPDLRTGCVALTGAGPLAGRRLPQGDVVGAASDIGLLDDVLGRGWALIAVAERQEDAFARLTVDPFPGARRVVVLPPHRIPRTAPGAVAVAELTPVLHAVPRPAHFLLVRPDRYVAADLVADQAASVAGALSRYLPRPAPLTTGGSA